MNSERTPSESRSPGWVSSLVFAWRDALPLLGAALIVGTLVGVWYWFGSGWIGLASALVAGLIHWIAMVPGFVVWHRLTDPQLAAVRPLAVVGLHIGFLLIALLIGQSDGFRQIPFSAALVACFFPMLALQSATLIRLARR